MLKAALNPNKQTNWANPTNEANSHKLGQFSLCNILSAIELDVSLGPFNGILILCEVSYPIKHGNWRNVISVCNKHKKMR